MTQNEMLKTESMKQPEQGRSMIEMLGTLAIMGVLSIGGIAGYGYAVDKYRANETIDELNKRAVIYATQVLNNTLQAGEYLSHGEYGDKTALGYTIEANNSYYPNEFEVTLTNYPSEVCRDILKNYMIPYQIIVEGKVYDPDSDNFGICGNDGETAPETLFVFTADLNQGKEEFEGSGIEFEGSGIPVSGSGVVCTSGVEFSSGGSCYPCDSTGSYSIYNEEEYALCRACGRRQAVDGQCVPGCMSGQVYDSNKKTCVTPECSSNSDCSGKGSNYYCELDFDIGGFESSCEQQPLYGRCVKATEGTRKTVTGVGTYVKSGSTMNWWNAQNYCQALEGSVRMATVADFGCGYDYVGANTWGYCNIDTSTSYSGTRSTNMQAFQTAFGKITYYWLNDSYSACLAYYANLYSGRVGNDSRSYYSYALCRVGF